MSLSRLEDDNGRMAGASFGYILVPLATGRPCSFCRVNRFIQMGNPLQLI